MRKLDPKKRWYKILTQDGKSVHGDWTWSLPSEGAPGEWQRLGNDDPLRQCVNGFHLTDRPDIHWQTGMRVFLAEPRGNTIPCEGSVQVELVCREVQLVREMVGDELQAAVFNKDVFVATPPAAPRRPLRRGPAKPFPCRLYALLNGKNETVLGHFSREDSYGIPVSLPASTGPGPWATCPTDVPCVPKRAGFQLVTDILPYWRHGLKVFLAEIDGPFACSEGVASARRIRLVRRIVGDELDALTCPASIGPLGNDSVKSGRTDPRSTAISPGKMLIEHVRRNLSREVRDSTNRYNRAIHTATSLGIESGLRFLKGDFAGNLDGYYHLAVESRNESACRALEKQMGQDKFVWQGARLAVGSHFQWEGRSLTVTSIPQRSTLIACEYARGEHGTKVVRRIKITSDALRAAEKARLVANRVGRKA